MHPWMCRDHLELNFTSRKRVFYLLLRWIFLCTFNCTLGPRYTVLGIFECAHRMYSYDDKGQGGVNWYLLAMCEYSKFSNLEANTRYSTSASKPNRAIRKVRIVSNIFEVREFCRGEPPQSEKKANPPANGRTQVEKWRDICHSLCSPISIC